MSYSGLLANSRLGGDVLLLYLKGNRRLIELAHVLSLSWLLRSVVRSYDSRENRISLAIELRRRDLPFQYSSTDLK